MFRDRYVIQQYIGLKDKNVNEIFEGDIVMGTGAMPLSGALPNNKVHLPSIGTTVKVLFHDGQYKMQKTSDSKRFQLNSLTIRMAGIEIVGNIFETPELLKSFSTFH